MSVKRSAAPVTGTPVMTASSFSWNGHEIVIPSAAELEPVFGPPDRVKKTSPNTILTWDSLGLYAYIEQRSKQLISMAIALRLDTSREFRPTSVFTGDIALPWCTVRASTTQEELLAAGFKQDFGTHLSRIEATAGYFAEFLEKDLVDLQLCRNE